VGLPIQEKREDRKMGNAAEKFFIVMESPLASEPMDMPLMNCPKCGSILFTRVESDPGELFCPKCLNQGLAFVDNSRPRYRVSGTTA
jgi:hypothetical protein